MQLNHAMWAMTAAEIVLWAALAIVFWSKGLHRRFPAMCAYLTLRAVSAPLLVFLLYEEARPWGHAHHLGQIYAWSFIAVYFASTALLYFICIEIFRDGAVGVSRNLEAGARDLPLGRRGRIHRQPARGFLHAEGDLSHRRHRLWDDALRQRAGAVPAGVSVPEHECVAPVRCAICRLASPWALA